jgi:branched-chain amino acid transport system permease protein
MLILGGMNTVTGAVTGTVVLTVGLEMIRALESGGKVAGIDIPALLGLSGASLGLVIVLVMAFRPQGICSRYELDEAAGELIKSARRRRRPL